jgi:putative colanic acid biosynthesis UDP-glucose lipid carrier transferase
MLIKLSSPGPVFFIQERTGLKGKKFKCYKFRSMKCNDEANTKQATKDDPRTTRIGRFIRRTSIDELPQFINVLKGDMSIVGPRPHPIPLHEKYYKNIKKYMVRHFVKPGITGLAQITGSRGETKEAGEMESRIKKDIWYIENWSVMLDMEIIIKTALVTIIGDKKAY